MVYNAFGIGGTVKTIFNFADYFYDTGKYDVEIISIKKTKDTPTLPVNPKIKITVIQDARRGAKFSEEDKELLALPSELIDKSEDLYPMFNAYTDKKMRELLCNFEGGVLVTTMPSFNMLATELVNDSVLKIGQEHKSYADHSPEIQKIIRESYGKLDGLTILTERNRHVYERKIHGELPIYVLGNGTERLKFRADLNSHVMVAAGRYAYQKGYDMLIEAFALIADKYPDWTLKIYGEGSLAKDYVRLIMRHGLGNRVVLESGNDKMNERYSEASINICSSNYEPFGMTIIEGFAMGLPCVSFACDGPREIITDGYDGLLVRKKDIEGFAAALERVMSDEELRFELGANAYETSKKYDINTIGQMFQKIVETELERKKKNKNNNSNIVNMPQKSENNNVVEIMERHIEDNVETEAIKPVQEELDYTQMIKASDEGHVGIRTIMKMGQGWANYKIRGNKRGKQ